MVDENIEDQTQNAGESGAQTPSDADGGQKPPWERDGEEFNPEKAWNLIQHLRDDNSKLKSVNETTSAKLREFEDAKLTEQEKMQRDLKEVREQLASVNVEKAWAEARAKYPQLTQQDFDLIGAGTPEEIADKAAKLAARIPAQDTENAARQAIIESERRKPLTGGSDPHHSDGGDWLRDALTNK
ncbi:hypothetical protein D2E25_0252 [Bifidobacterium goeldii]|uniref:Scaffolding protein n=1 Tax=Bifidobacterium goeldii TaxID=2306975 RepID=A0A430FM46_9BIFI|nr:hypothetical protein [Bifidobacterium goeldii]RSX53946.1 hypothetical protein D2E25_0252 [Bifidobacterium goeldii]